MKERLTVNEDGVKLSRSYSIEEDGIDTIKAVNRSMSNFTDSIKFDHYFRNFITNEDRTMKKDRNIKLKTDNYIIRTLY